MRTALEPRIFLKQTWALTKKNLLIAVVRHWFATLVRAIILPIVFMVLLSNIKNFLIAKNGFGISTPIPVQSLANSLPIDQKFIIVQSPNLGYDVSTAVAKIVEPLRSNKKLVFLSDEKELITTCVQSLTGVSDCFAAIVFNDSPATVGGNRIWNYTVRTDASLDGSTFYASSHNNDQERVYLPLQVTVDNAIRNSTIFPNEYLFSSISQATQDNNVRTAYIGLIISIYGIAFYIGLVSGVYHLVGMITTERESGMAPLIDAMGGSPAARVCSYVLAFDMIYLLSWIVIGIVFWVEVFRDSNAAIPIFWQVFNGLALTSASVFAASFFNRAQLSGVYTVIGFLVVAVIGQIIDTGSPATAEVAVLSLIFPGMNYMFMIGYIGRYERQNLRTNLIRAAPATSDEASTSQLNAIVMLLFLVLQIFIYPLLAVLVERWLHGANSKGRTVGVNHGNVSSSDAGAVETSGLTKIYPRTMRQRLFSRNKAKDVVAVDHLDMTAQKGQILCLLGANGSGKTTTLSMIGGLQKLSSGSIRVSAQPSKLGVCPQQNVLWDELTVDEHVRIWNNIKCSINDSLTHDDLIEACNLSLKKDARADTLSGGQKRKLQLACMFVGGSTVCLLDEVSSGLDPLSRRIIWNIILAERGKRTMILTTHFLDEADVLADHIIIISLGVLKCEGSSVELKDQFGGGYRVHLPANNHGPNMPYPTKRIGCDTVYSTNKSSDAAQLLGALEAMGHSDVFVNGPTIEDVFLKVAQESPTVLSADEDDHDKILGDLTPIETRTQTEEIKLSSGQDISFYRQSRFLVGKRLTVLLRNWLPYFFALAIPIAVTPAIYTFIKNYQAPGCSGGTYIASNQAQPLNLEYAFQQVGNLQLLVAPNSINKTVYDLISTFPIGLGLNLSNYTNQFIFEDSYAGFQNHISNLYTNVTPGGLYMDSNTSVPTYAYVSDSGIIPAMIMQNLYTQLRSGLPIAAYYTQFDSLIPPGAGNTFEYIVYFCLTQAVYPAFFALYPTFERLRKVRALQYSNGVRPRPLWFSYAVFDLAFVLVISVVCTAVIASQAKWWFAAGYMFPVLMLYGIAATLMVYTVSLVAGSQLAAFAFAAGGGAIMVLLSILTFILVETYTPVGNLTKIRDVTTFTLNMIFPVGNVVRAMLVGFNVYLVNCRDNKYIPSGNSIYAYGGPILYLCTQICFLSWLVLWLEGGRFPSVFQHNHSLPDNEYELRPIATEVEDEKLRVDTDSSDPLRVAHLTKRFGHNLAVDNVSFGVGHGEVFALLGPNGAGKSTTIDVVRGELSPNEGTAFLEGMDIIKNMRIARKHLGVCPQFDALDLLTTREHLEFYARVKGVPTVEQDVNTVMHKVGLEVYASRLASKLSGGNKRKLSLAIALIGNPTVLVLDEPSSSMDAASKRIMWKTLSEVTTGRSLLLTTHSMEEADALATRAAIMSQRILAIGTTKFLREKYGNVYHVHLVLNSAPQSTREEMIHVEEWVEQAFSGVQFDKYGSLHGQIKFSVPAVFSENLQNIHEDPIERVSAERNHAIPQKKSVVRALFSQLEENKQVIGLRSYSVGATTLDQVFLNVVSENNVREEGYAVAFPGKQRGRFICF